MVTSVAISPYPRPFLKWAGGKGRLLTQYEPFFPTSFSRYFEPFLGGGAVFFHLYDRFPQAVLADLNWELVNVYQCVQRQVEALIQRLLEHRQHHSQAYYYQVRQQTDLGPNLDRAARLIYLNKTCYNGLYRENSKGHFNVPMGTYKKPAICDPDLLRAASAALQHCQIQQMSFDVMSQLALTHHDFVYFDPPYYPISATSSFTNYSRYGFTSQDQVKLAQVFRQLARRGVKVMLSNSDCDFIRDLYHGFPIHPIKAARAINSNARRRGKITEVLITSY